MFAVTLRATPTPTERPDHMAVQISSNTRSIAPTPPPVSVSTPAPPKAARAGKKPGVPVNATVSAAIAGLAVGESFSRSKRMSFSEAAKADLARVFNNLASTLTSPIYGRSGGKNENEYKVERGQFVTNDGHLVLTVVVTRTA